MFHQLADAVELPIGTYLFTDIEIASPLQRELLSQVWNNLARDGRSQLYNNPAKALGRYDLLSMLSREGINAFRAFRSNELPTDLRFPVFVRIETDHWGSRTPLLETWDDLDAWLVKAGLGGAPSDQILVTEFCDTKDSAGIYRKYSCFFVKGKLVPRHIHFSKNWMLKMWDIAEPETLREEREFMDRVPCEDELRHVFNLAWIDYGRADFSFLDGRIQIWEINTNPALTLELSKYPPALLPTQERFAKSLAAVFQEIDSAGAVGRVRNEIQFPKGCPQTFG